MTVCAAHHCRKLLLGVVWMAIAAPAAITQSGVAPPGVEPAAGVSVANGKPMAFEVVSIRPSKPGSNWAVRWAISQDGYSVAGQSIFSTILLAYFPQSMAYWSKDRLSGAPSWLGKDLYDIDAKVAPSDIAEWRKQGNTLEQKKMLQEMLQSMLAERCKLVAHRVQTEIAGHALVIDKRGPKLTETKTGETFPSGLPLPDGGVEVPYRRGEKAQTKFYGVSMASFARQLSSMSGGQPVEDRTGLTGRYDIVLSWLDELDSDGKEGFVSPSDPNPLSHWNVEALGLTLKPMKLPSSTLVIDHIERPSEN